MTAEDVIEQIRKLSAPEDLNRVGTALEEHRAELAGDIEAARRINELQAGGINPLSHEEVFRPVRDSICAG